MINNEIEYNRMAAAEQTHWWYFSLHKLVYKSIQRYFPDQREIKIVDAGCGTGGLLLFLRNRGYNNISGFDISEFALSICRERNLSVFRGSLTGSAHYFPPNTLDVIICCDVLYFLPPSDQKKVLDTFQNLLKPGGILVFNLPSLKIFSGIHDLSVGISERYHHKTLTKLFSDSDLKYTFKYWPVFLSPIIGIVRTCQRLKIKTGNYILKSDITLPVNFINKLLIMLIEFEIKYLPPINLGSSLFVTARKS